MADTVAIGIIASEAASAVKAAPNLTEKLRAAMKLAANHWMVLDRNVQLQGALAAVLQDVGVNSPDGLRIQAELKIHRALNAAASGVPVDFGAVLGDEGEERPPFVGIAKLWQEANA